MDIKEIEVLLKQEGDKLVTSNFNDVKKKIKLTNRYIEMSLNKEGNSIVPDKPNDVKPNVHIRIFTLPRLAALTAILVLAVTTPILINTFNQPVAYCDASVKVIVIDENEQTLTYRLETYNDEVDIESIYGLDDNANIALAGLKEYNVNDKSLFSTISLISEIEENASLLSSNKLISINILAKDQNTLDSIKNGANERNFTVNEGLIMEKGSGYILSKYAVRISDYATRIFKDADGFNPNNFSVNHLMDDMKNNYLDYQKAFNELHEINDTLLTNEQVSRFNTDLQELPNSPRIDSLEEMDNAIRLIDEEFKREPGKHDYLDPNYVPDKDHHFDNIWDDRKKPHEEKEIPEDSYPFDPSHVPEELN